MMSDSQNSNNGKPSPTLNGEISPETTEPAPKSYYYDDATGYEIYQEGNEPADEEEMPDAQEDH
jgi:hypothetical protein